MLFSPIFISVCRIARLPSYQMDHRDKHRQNMPAVTNKDNNVNAISLSLTEAYPRDSRPTFTMMTYQVSDADINAMKERLRASKGWRGLTGGQGGRRYIPEIDKNLRSEIDRFLRPLIEETLNETFPSSKARTMKFGAIQTLPGTPSQYFGHGGVLHSDFDESTRWRDETEQPWSVIFGLDDFNFMYLESRHQKREDIKTLTVKRGQLIMFSNNCLHSGGAYLEGDEPVYRLFAYVVCHDVDIPNNTVNKNEWNNDNTVRRKTSKKPRPEPQRKMPPDDHRPSKRAARATSMFQSTQGDKRKIYSDDESLDGVTAENMHEKLDVARVLLSIGVRTEPTVEPGAQVSLEEATARDDASGGDSKGGEDVAWSTPEVVTAVVGDQMENNDEAGDEEMKIDTIDDPVCQWYPICDNYARDCNGYQKRYCMYHKDDKYDGEAKRRIEWYKSKIQVIRAREKRRAKRKKLLEEEKEEIYKQMSHAPQPSAGTVLDPWRHQCPFWVMNPWWNSHATPMQHPQIAQIRNSMTYPQQMADMQHFDTMFSRGTGA